MPDRTLTLSQRRVIGAAKVEGWSHLWQHNLLILSRYHAGRLFLVQVLFKDGRWDYALTFNRLQGSAYSNESSTEIVPTLRGLIQHLVDPS